MFGGVKSLNEEAKTELYYCNKTLDKGEETIKEGNDNIRTDEILNNIEIFELSINNLFNAISTINSNLDTLSSDISTSMSIREQELKAEEMTYEDN